MKLFDVYPLFDITLENAQGSYVWDTDGVKYLDLYGGHAVISIGHSHPHYVSAIANQLNKIGFYSNSVKIKQQEVLAEKLGKASGYNDYHLFLCNSGAEANENAFKLASFHTGKKKIIAFQKSFHGRTSLAVATTDDPSIVAPVNETSCVEFLPLNDAEAFDKAMNDDVAAVVVEGIQGVGGIQIPQPVFLQQLRAACDKFGALLILDEIQSGYGRSGKFFAHQHSSIKPDIITMAKGMGNGFPVAGVLINPKVKAKHGLLGTTFGGNYLACASAIAVLEVIEKEQLVHRAAESGEYLMQELAKLAGIKEIRGLGLMIGIELEYPCAAMRSELLKEYKIFTGSASNKNVLRILPALNIQKDELDYFVRAFGVLLEKQLVK